MPTSRPTLTLQKQNQQRMEDLQAAVDRFQEQANALPGKDDAEHRAIMEKAFDDLHEAMPILAGEGQSGAFRLQMRSIHSAREELAGNPNLAPEPIEDSGLRSAVAAMGRIASKDFYSGLRPDVNKLRLSLRPLDRTTGPMHRLVVRDVVRQMADVLRSLAETYRDHVVGPTETIQPTTRQTAE
jgi:hypothetical protein